MDRRFHALPALALTLALAACGGGASSSSPAAPVPTPTATPSSPGNGGSTGGQSFSITPSAMSLGSPGASGTFTVSSQNGVTTVPHLDTSFCNGVASVSGGGSALPVTYTVTASGNGSCSLVLYTGTQVATLPVVVGTNASPASLAASPSSLSFSAAGAPAQGFTVNASGGPAGTVGVDAGACNGIATVSGSSGAPPQTYTVTPVGAGTCSVVVADGATATTVIVSVGQTTGPGTLTLTPSSLTFSAPNAAAQTTTVGYQGYVGSVTYAPTGCTGIATFSIPNGPLPQTATVTPQGPGTCTVMFTATNASSVTLTITVQ